MAKAATKAQPWKVEGLNKAEWVAREVAKAVNAGKAWDLETVDFSDPNRPLTCLEVDFPIIPINQIAAIEGNAGKPIYQMSKWWARRRSSVFRSMLLAAAIKAPDDPSEAAKLVWDVYYGNHQKKGTFKHLKVADIFMGGGTTVVEGSRLGMQMYGNDLNPVAWFVVKNELAQVDKEQVETLLAEIEAEVKPQIMPFYACDCPRGHKGKWTQVSTGKVMGKKFDPLTLTPDERRDYSYEGPEVIYTFWAKHGPCQVTDCGHRTPIMSSPVMAVKSISIKAWKRKCKHCGEHYDIEERDARMAPGVELVVADTEHPFAVANLNMVGSPESAVCPHCGKEDTFGKLAKPSKKAIELSLLVHPDWLKGESSQDKKGNAYGGSADDPVDATVRWNKARAETCKLIEVRGTLPDEITLTDGTVIKTGKEGGTVPGKSTFACASCGTSNDVREAIAATKKNGPIAIYAVQGFCPCCKDAGELYNGRFFAAVTDSCSYDTSVHEWEERKDSDLAGYWPTSEVPYGFMTAMNNGDIRKGHGFTHWWKMFNPRQLIVHAALLKALSRSENEAVAEFVLGAFQQYLRNQNLFCIWDISRDCMAPHLSNNNYYPKSTPVESCVFADLGRGNWQSQYGNLFAALDWTKDPYETVHTGSLGSNYPYLAEYLTGTSEKALCGDPLIHKESLACLSSSEQLTCGTSTELETIADGSYDAVITDPPFGGLLHYSELADFFYVWLRLALNDKYPEYFAAEYTPKTMEAVANRARHPGDDPDTGLSNADTFYQRLLTACWMEAKRILKPAGILSFTFHHSEDAPWVSVLESLFDAGFYLEATYPIRSDETKGAGAKPGTFGSQTIEYDIIHVCRQRHEEPKSISWPKLRRQVLQDVRELKELLEHHQAEGLPEADLQVIRRGKALEYFSRHYGKVYKDQETSMSVLEALLGINQLLDEEAGGIKEPPPHNAEPFTRMLLRLFDGKAELPRDQIQKFLRGTGSAPSDFVSRDWVTEQKKIFYLVPPLEVAESWVGKQRKGMTSDYDQAMFFIGACFENSGINASETLNNPNFLPHPALGGLLTWFKTHGADSPTRNAASTASQLYRSWEAKNQPKMAQLSLFDMLGEDD
jgi:putative DNA methylase